jgi:hypothetical protein
MEPIPSPPEAQRNGIVPVWWRCVRCTTERHDEHNPVTLEIVTRKYVWPDGYRTPRGEEAPSKLAWKGTYFRLIGAITTRQATANRQYRKELWETGEN